MSTLAQIVERRTPGTRSTLEQTHLDRDVFMPTIDVLRANRTVVMMTIHNPSDHDPAHMISHTIAAAATLFDAEVLLLTVDNYSSRLDHDPTTGRPWEPGAMSRLGQEGLDRGWITESVTIAAANRAGDLSISSLEYRREPHAIIWGKTVSNGAASEVAGRLAEMLRTAMLGPSLTQNAAAQRVDILPRRELDVVAAEKIAQLLPVSLALVVKL